MSFPAVIDLGSLDGSNGFRINGIAAGDFCGFSAASAGDVNGDGVDDLIIGAYRADPNGRGFAGQSYVVFGNAGGFTASLDLATLNGSNGFRLDGIDTHDLSGFSVASAGDVNNDGFDDVLIGAYFGRGFKGSGGFLDAGETYVLFGKADGFSAIVDPRFLDGPDGFHINGIHRRDWSGYSVASAGDINGDGFDDIIVGAPRSEPLGIYAYGGGYETGTSFVVFGSAAAFPESLFLSSLDGTNGFRIDGANPWEYSGTSVASAGDVNGDGFDDLVIGAPGASPDGMTRAGRCYVVFGSGSGFSASLSLATLDGSNGFSIEGLVPGDRLGKSVASAGDINGDGFDDIIVGAPAGVGNDGEAYVVFGSASGFAATLDLATLDGSNGFRVDDYGTDDYTGVCVSGAGDVNGDGIDDFIVGANGSDLSGDADAGLSYVVFGSSSGFGARLDLTTLDGTNGFRIDGIDAGDQSGLSARGAGDVNGDGLADIIIGAPMADPNGAIDAGESYVIFGRVSDDGVTLTGTAIGQTMRGGLGDDTIAGRGGDDVLIGQGGDDRLDGGDGDDLLLGGSGDDVILGGLGIDRASYTSASAGVVVSLALAGTAQDTVGGGIDTLINVEGVVGSAFADTLTGNSGNNILGGDAGDDILSGGAGDDSVNGGDGDDVMYDGTGSDVMRGGFGDDIYVLADNLNSLLEYEGRGTDEVRVFGQNFTLGANFENLRIRAGAVNGTGNELNNSLYGSSNNNTLSGLDGNDILDGKAGIDILLGGNGNDILIGGAGRDTLTGGAGADRFTWRSTAEGNPGLSAADTITDFSKAEADKINLAGIDANTTNGSGNDDFAFIGTGTFSGVAGQLRYFASGTDTIVQMDVNGDSVADLSIRLTGTIALTASDFIGVLTGQAPLAVEMPVMVATDMLF